MSTEGDKASLSTIRWWLLALLCIAIYSFVYCYDNPFAIQNQLIDDYSLTNVQYNLLYGVYGYVNFIAPLIAGLLIDCIGINSSTLFFYILIVFGHSLWFFGCFESIKSFPLMIVGRAIFGVGAEQFHTSRKWLLYEYFAGSEYYFASALSLSFSRFASASQSYISSTLYEKNGIVAVLSVGWILTVFSLSLLILFFLIFKPQNVKNTLSKSFKCVHDCRWWLLGINLCFFYSAYLSYSNVGSAFLQNRYKLDYKQANAFAPLTFWISAIFTPFFGFFCDFYGRRTVMMFVSGIFMLFGHMLLGFVGSENESLCIPIFGLMFLGFAYSIGASALWPSFGLIVQEQRYLATTLGIWGSIDNAFQACMSLIVGVLTKDYDKNERAVYNDQYDDARFVWIGLSVGVILWTLLLWIVDAKKYENSLGKRSEKFVGKRLSDLFCTKKKEKNKENEDGKTKNVDESEESEKEDNGLLIDGGYDATTMNKDQILGIGGYTAYDL